MKRRLLGAALLVAGAVLVAGALWPLRSPWQVSTEAVAAPSDYQGHYPIAALARWQLHDPSSGRRLTLHVARYRSAGGDIRQAILPPPATPAWHDWQILGETLRRLEADALILAWWDDAQRVDLLGGRQVWVRQPSARAFPPRDRALWRRISGGFAADEDRLMRLARWLAAPADEGLAALRRATPVRPRYLLVSTATLTRLEEIRRLAGRAFPLEMKIFPPGRNLHAQIAAVRRWAGETGFGYLPRKVPAGIAAWRLTRPEPRPLLLRLLPFTTVSPDPPPGLTLVFQSPDHQLRLYRLQ